MTCNEPTKRSEAFKAAKHFLSGQDCAEDISEQLQQKHPTDRKQVFHSDVDAREFSRFHDNYYSHVQRIELQQTAWQNFDPASSQIQSLSFSGQGIVGAVDLILADQWYQEQHQPKPS